MESYTKSCRKLHISHGLGDCLRKLLLDFKVPSYNKSTGGTVYTSFEFRDRVKPAEWELNNSSVICDFINNVAGIKFISWEEYIKLPIPLLTSGETRHLEMAPFYLKADKLPILHHESKKNIAIQSRGGGYDTSPKQFSYDMIVSLVEALDATIYDIHIIDMSRGSYVSELKNVLNCYSNVYFYNHSFLQNYALVSLCDGLIAPDSWSKYVLNASGQDLNKIIVCTQLDYVSCKEQLLKTYFKQLVNPRTRILGYAANGEAIPNVAALDMCDMLGELTKMLASI
jgi:hypothetical protein